MWAFYLGIASSPLLDIFNLLLLHRIKLQSLIFLTDHIGFKILRIYPQLTLIPMMLLHRKLLLFYYQLIYVVWAKELWNLSFHRKDSYVAYNHKSSQLFQRIQLAPTTNLLHKKKKRIKQWNELVHISAQPKIIFRSTYSYKTTGLRGGSGGGVRKQERAGLVHFHRQKYYQHVGLFC